MRPRVRTLKREPVRKHMSEFDLQSVVIAIGVKRVVSYSRITAVRHKIVGGSIIIDQYRLNITVARGITPGNPLTRQTRSIFDTDPIRDLVEVEKRGEVTPGITYIGNCQKVIP